MNRILKKFRSVPFRSVPFVLFLFLMIPAAPGAFADSPTILAADSPSRVPDQYIVVFKSQPTARTPEAVQDLTANLLAAYPKAKLLHSYSHVLQGFAAHMSEAAAEALVQNPNVAWVEADQIIHTGSVQSNPPWGLDRVDQRATYLDDLYHHSTTGDGITGAWDSFGFKVFCP